MSVIQIRLIENGIDAYDIKGNNIYSFSVDQTFYNYQKELFDRHIMKKYIRNKVNDIILYDIKSYISFKERVISLFYRLKRRLRKIITEQMYPMEKYKHANIKKEDIFELDNIFSNIDPKKHITITEYKNTLNKYVKVMIEGKLARITINIPEVSIYNIHHYDLAYVPIITLMMHYVSFFVLNK